MHLYSNVAKPCKTHFAAITVVNVLWYVQEADISALYSLQNSSSTITLARCNSLRIINDVIEKTLTL